MVFLLDIRLHEDDRGVCRHDLEPVEVAVSFLFHPHGE